MNLLRRKKTVVTIIGLFVLMIGVFGITQVLDKNNNRINLETRSDFKKDNVSTALPLQALSQKNIGPLSDSYLEYINQKFGFSFWYPEGWIMTEVNLKEVYADVSGYSIYKDGIQISLTDPQIEKKVYDCCYSKEEYEKYTTTPKITIRIFKPEDWERYNFIAEDRKKWSQNTKNIYTQLSSSGYGDTLVQTVLSFIPQSGEPQKDNSSVPFGQVVWIDDCEQVVPFEMSNAFIVKLRGCAAGIALNTHFIIGTSNGYILDISDHSSEYEKRKMLDPIIESFAFIKK